ncbi:unnamed protein product [Brassica rapa subsp. trilocularis]
MNEAKKKKKLDSSIGVPNDDSISALAAFSMYLITGLFLGVGFWVARNKFSVDLVSDPPLTLFLLWSIEFPVVVIIFSLLRNAPEKCSCFRAIGRSILGLISDIELMLTSLFASHHMQISTKNSSLVLSNVCFHGKLPLSAASYDLEKKAIMVILRIYTTAVLGASWTDWHRVFASMKPSGNVEYMIIIPAYGAIIGGWFGAWPMPLDWERPWQEWPICVCYGAIGGYIVGQILSLCAMFFLRKHKKID